MTILFSRRLAFALGWQTASALSPSGSLVRKGCPCTPVAASRLYASHKDGLCSAKRRESSSQRTRRMASSVISEDSAEGGEGTAHQEKRTRLRISRVLRDRAAGSTKEVQSAQGKTLASDQHADIHGHLSAGEPREPIVSVPCDVRDALLPQPMLQDAHHQTEGGSLLLLCGTCHGIMWHCWMGYF